MKQKQKIKFALMSVVDIKNYGDTLLCAICLTTNLKICAKK